MYTLNKAKEEIDLVAKHASEIADHLIAMSGTIDSKLDLFKADIISTIEAKFAELARTIHGDVSTVESSAVADLGAKVSLLSQGAAKPESQGDAGLNFDTCAGGKQFYHGSDGQNSHENRPTAEYDEI